MTSHLNTVFKTNANMLIWILLLLSSSSQITAETGIDAQSLSKVIILDSGRKMPLETYAKNKLMQFSGRQSYKGESAAQWIAKLLFDPYSTSDHQVFLINDPQIPDALGIEPRAKRRYSYAELHKSAVKLDELYLNALYSAPEGQTPFEKEIVRTRHNIQEYLVLSTAFGFLEPDPAFLIRDSSLAVLLKTSGLNRPLSYFEVLSRSHAISSQISRIENAQLDSLSAGDNALINLARSMYHQGITITNSPPHFIPGRDSTGKEEWFSPWGYVGNMRSGAVHDTLLRQMISIYEAFKKGDQKGFDLSVDIFCNTVQRTYQSKYNIPDPKIELFYGRLNPYLFSKILYGMAAILAFFAAGVFGKRVYAVSLLLTLAGFALHFTGLILRTIIVRNPPVTSPFGTVVFVAWAAVLLGLIIESKNKRSAGILVSSITGFLFLHISGKYAAEGDTMGVLAAVLDTTFWLTTHIISISLGYAGLLGAAVLSHLYLIRRAFGHSDSLQSQETEKTIAGIFSFGLLFTIMGTVLGGMWADQAWGRFWGWDPKENGALLIIIWTLSVLHARSAGIIKGTGLAIGAVMAAALVMCTWIGVNLLGIGLHSYGASSSEGHALIIYLSLEVLFLISTGFVLRLKAAVHPKSSN